MKIIFSGKNLKIDNQNKPEIEISSHSETYQPTYFAREFEKLGYKTAFWDIGGYIENVNDIEGDALFIRGAEQLRMFVDRYGYVKMAKYMFCHLDRGDTKVVNCKKVAELFDLVSFTCDCATDIWKKHYSDNGFTAGYGFPEDWEFPLTAESPYKKDKKILLYVGAMYDKRYTEFIDNVAKALPDVEIHIIGSLLQTDKLYMKLKTTPQENVAGLIFNAKNIILHGPMKYGTFNNYIYHADLGLNYSPYVLMVVHCKVWDYLAMGLPTISIPKNNPENFLIEKTGGGFCVSDFDEYIKAIKTGLNLKFDRASIAMWMRANEGYGSVVKRWDKEIKKLI